MSEIIYSNTRPFIIDKYNFSRIYLLCLGLLKIQTRFQYAYLLQFSVSNLFIIFEWNQIKWKLGIFIYI